ncbi:hypothetical protein D3C87_2058610 [compost metagenome]
MQERYDQALRQAGSGLLTSPTGGESNLGNPICNVGQLLYSLEANEHTGGCRKVLR